MLKKNSNFILITGLLVDLKILTFAQANHGVLIVGYEKDYWIVKNSWGGSWGQDGYIYFKYDRNACGLANEPIFANFK